MTSSTQGDRDPFERYNVTESWTIDRGPCGKDAQLNTNPPMPGGRRLIEPYITPFASHAGAMLDNHVISGQDIPCTCDSFANSSTQVDSTPSIDDEILAQLIAMAGCDSSEALQRIQKWRCIKTLIRKEHIQFMAIQETKLKKVNNAWCREIQRGDDYYMCQLSLNGLSGGLLSIWKACSMMEGKLTCWEDLLQAKRDIGGGTWCLGNPYNGLYRGMSLTTAAP
ncbi:hypothetical protein VNO77_18843 [Canavalia gladiata]|uniref:Uncharacterized protein n=1 Tax=Canavalia gladiata TaxID=3824 RepID=A0AAN9QI14_CANGL